MMSENKLHIEVAGNVLDVEGDATLVKAVYEDFKQQIANAEAGVASESALNQPVADVDTQPLPSAGNADAVESFAIAPTLPDSTRSDVAPIIQIAENLELEDS